MAEAKLKAVFNAARRYCIDRVGAHESKILLYQAARVAAQDPKLRQLHLSWNYQWAQRVRQAPPLDQLPPFAREEQERTTATGILAAILEEIERRDANDFRDVADWAASHDSARFWEDHFRVAPAGPCATIGTGESRPCPPHEGVIGASPAEDFSQLALRFTDPIQYSDEAIRALMVFDDRRCDV
jgi:hypothetical protein